MAVSPDKLRRVFRRTAPLARMMLRPGHRPPIGVAPVRLRRAELLQAAELLAYARRRRTAIALPGGNCRFRRQCRLDRDIEPRIDQRQIGSAELLQLDATLDRKSTRL